MALAPTLRRGSDGPAVAALQKALGVDDDGHFGPRTEQALADWQEAHGLYADGVYGPDTQKAMGAETKPASQSWAKVPADKYGDGYDRFTLRADVAVAYQKVYDAAHAAGAIITSAGGRRNLTAGVSATRSSTSLHYLGRALDLALYSGMVDPAKDPYIVVLDDAHKRLWRVYARASRGEIVTLQARKYTGETVEVRARVIDLTALFAGHDFERIPARVGFFGSKRNDLAAEWWHFQWTTGLDVNHTQFGDELMRVWGDRELEGTGPWALRKRVWDGSGFVVRRVR
jgi:hypothetical protein